jgi:hypothetical protein
MIRILLVVFALASGCFASPASAATTLNDLPQFLQLEGLERALKLTPAQKEQYDMAVGATKRVMLAVTLAAVQAKERLAAELAKPRPDFRALEGLRDELLGETRTLRREAREEWMKLYAMLDQAQVAELRDFLERRLDHLGLLHDFLRNLPADRPKPQKESPYYW